MISVAQLWMPIVLTAILVFIASSLIHMVFKWHNSEYRALPNEDEVRAAIRKTNPAPGQYGLPHCTDMKDLATPQMQQKFIEGPIAFLTVRASGLPKMGPQLGQWFLLNLLVAALVAHIACATLPVGAVGARVFHVVAIVTALTYAGGSVQNGIWMGKPWSSVAKDILDALIYGVISGAVFAWLWPR